MTELSLTLRGGVLVDERYQNFPTTGASTKWHNSLGQRWRRLLYDRQSYGHPFISFVGMPFRYLPHLELLFRRRDTKILDAQLLCVKDIYKALSKRWSLHGPIGRKWRDSLSEVRLHQRQHDHGFQWQQRRQCSQLGTHTCDCRLALVGGAA